MVVTITFIRFSSWRNSFVWKVVIFPRLFMYSTFILHLDVSYKAFYFRISQEYLCQVNELNLFMIYANQDSIAVRNFEYNSLISLLGRRNLLAFCLEERQEDRSKEININKWVCWNNLLLKISLTFSLLHIPVLRNFVKSS